ncbi:uncharacterized protein [Dendropsophus ebraccatus]|uniref:uncharacterized protein n=1 Tax=Dendropsophus ebraccatus TaxID=150705 RepID=UPI0038310043
MGRMVSLLLLLGHTCCALEVTVSPSQIVTVQTDAVLTCTFKVDKPPVNPQFLAIIWHFGEKEIARHDSKGTLSASRFTIDEQAIQQGDASLTIHNVTISDQGTYKCSVVYSPNSQQKSVLLNILAVPVVKIQKKAMESGKPSVLQCSIANFFPNDMKVTWLKNGQSLSGSVTSERMNADNTYTAISKVNVMFLKEQGNPNMTCKVEHPYLKDPIKDFYIVQYGVAPTVNIKASRTPDGKDQIYMCEAKNYFPQEVTMSWLLDGKRIDSGGQSNKGLFNKEICYRIEVNGENPPSEISCEVQHEILQSPIITTEEIKLKRDCYRSCHSGIIGVIVLLLIAALPAVWYFTRRETSKESQWFQVGHIHIVHTGEKVTMYCTASNCPEEVMVTWRITEIDGKKIEISDDKQERDEEAALLVSEDYTVDTERSRDDKFHHAISGLSFTPVVSKHKDMEVSCIFHYNKNSQEKNRKSQKSQEKNRKSKEKSLKCGFSFRKPEVSGPVQMSLGDNGDVICSFSLENFFPKDIKIQWSGGLGHFQDVQTLHETFTKNDDFTFNVRSECRLPGHLFKDQEYRVRATWSHKTESGQLEASLTDSGWRPVMGEIEKPTFIYGKEAKLLCPVSGYFPDALDVKWLRREAESQEFYIVSDGDKYRIPIVEATQQEDKTFAYTACLILSVCAETDSGAEFMCRVRHPSLVTSLEKRTGENRVIGIGAVTVTLLDKDKLRAKISHFTPKDIRIAWSRDKDKKRIPVENKHVTLIIESNSDGTYTAYSEAILKDKSDHYYLVVEHDASKSVIEKTVLREKGEFYLIDNENQKIPLSQNSGQQHNHAPPSGFGAVTVSLLDKHILRAEVSCSTPEDIKITWSRKTTKTPIHKYEECKDATRTKENNSDGSHTAHSDITLMDKTAGYKVTVENKASKSKEEKKVRHENSEWFIIDSDNRKTPLPQISQQQQG